LSNELRLSSQEILGVAPKIPFSRLAAAHNGCLKFNRPFEKDWPRENGVMRFNMPLLRRFAGKLIHDILPAALASLLGGFLITHFQLNRVPEPVTVPVARASPEMMQLLRDEHGLIVDFVKAQVASEKNTNEKNASEKRQLVADESARVAAESPATPGLAAAPAAPRPTMIVALTPAKPAVPRAKALVLGASLPPLATAPVQQSEGAPPPPVARNDDSLLAKTIGITDRVVAVSQRAVSAIGVIPSWFGSVGDRIGGEDPSPRPPTNVPSANLVSSSWTSTVSTLADR
jgi:hypothetical protein